MRHQRVPELCHLALCVTGCKSLRFVCVNTTQTRNCCSSAQLRQHHPILSLVLLYRVWACGHPPTTIGRRTHSSTHGGMYVCMYVTA